MREEEKPNASALHGSGKQAIKAMSPRLFDTVGGAMGGEKGNRGGEAIRENHDDGEPVGSKQEAEAG